MQLTHLTNRAAQLSLAHPACSGRGRRLAVGQSRPSTLHREGATHCMLLAWEKIKVQLAVSTGCVSLLHHHQSKNPRSNHWKSGAVCKYLGGREFESVVRIFWILLEDSGMDPGPSNEVGTALTWLGAFSAPAFRGCLCRLEGAQRVGRKGKQSRGAWRRGTLWGAWGAPPRTLSGLGLKLRAVSQGCWHLFCRKGVEGSTGKVREQRTFLEGKCLISRIQPTESGSVGNALQSLSG